MPQAILEYQQILKNEPKDQVTLMTLGDLFVRQGDTFQALEYFERLAKIFLNDGFTTKAIAIYKKVAKLAPEESRPLERLAELYVQQGVLSEARPLYLQLAEVHIKSGPPAAGRRAVAQTAGGRARQPARTNTAGGTAALHGAAERSHRNILHRHAKTFRAGRPCRSHSLGRPNLAIGPSAPATFQLKVTALTACG